MLLKRSMILLLLFITTLKLSAQENNYQIEFQKMTGALTKSDLFKSGFGRYDGYEIEFHEGERVHFLVYTEHFIPSMVFVSPDGKTYQQDIEKNDEYATIQTKINQSGEWVLYILADESSFGEYYFQYGIAEQNLFFINENSNFCEELDFLLAHSIAYFIFLGGEDSDDSILKINGATDAYIDGHDASYNARLYDGNSLEDAQRMVDYMVNEVKNCIPAKWKVNERGWMKVRDYREKYTIITENISKEPRFVRIGLLDFRDSPEHNQNNFLVDIAIGRK